ncbi:hypothetical protein EV122DRAFT_189490, partial [Schizophyllum commune]
SPTKKARIPRMYEHEHMSWSRIGRELNISRDCARRNYEKMKKMNDPYHNGKVGRCGRHRRLSGEQEKDVRCQMVQAIESGQATDGAAVRKLVCPYLGESTVRRMLAEMGLNGRVRRRKPELKAEH